MCTLTYFPKGSGFVFTHTRDESPGRPASEKLQKQQVASGPMYFPQDLQASGTWMALSENRAACLLNGGSKPYQPKALYPVSRGSIIPHCFQHASVDEFYQKFDLSAFEPFTLVVREAGRLYQLIHDPDQNQLQEHNAQEAKIWSSTKLYSPEIRQQRHDQFFTWLAQIPEPSAKDLKNFHLRGNEDAESPGFRIKVPGKIETVSLTQIVFAQQKASIFYLRLPGMESDLVLI